VNPEWWQAAVMGVVQGLTEFLPVSSTGHLALVPALLGWHDSVVDRLEFDVALHIGTLGALLGVFWRDWIDLAAAGLRSLRDRSLEDPDARLAWMLVVGTIPAVVVGVLFERQVERELRSPFVIGTAMAVVGIALGVVDALARGERTERSMGWGACLAVGLGQAAALIPGVSRSGATIGVGLAAGLTRASAARYSFLLSTPVITGAIAKQGFNAVQRGIPPEEMVTYAIGILASGISGYATIRWFLRYLRGRSLRPFVVYRVLAGLAIIGLAASGRISGG
jgi:undecaprenyl-diphosphatase